MSNPLSNVNGSSPTGASALPSAQGARPLDREAFLKLLVAQVRQQDPLKPMEGTEFVTQLAQFSVVEQAIQQSRQLDAVSTQLGGLANNAATSLVGQSVTVRGSQVAFDGSQAVPVNATLQGDAAKVTVTVRDAAGNVVRSVELPGHNAGTFSWTWDGRDNNGARVAAGSYRVGVAAQNSAGDSVATTQDVTGLVRRVGYDRGYPELELDSGARAPISDLVAVNGRSTSTPANPSPSNATSNATSNNANTNTEGTARAR